MEKLTPKTGRTHGFTKAQSVVLTGEDYDVITDKVNELITQLVDIVPQRYTATLAQASTNAPTVSFEDDGIGITWTRTGAGSYVGTSDGKYTEAKTFIFHSDNAAYSENFGCHIQVKRNNTNQILIFTRDDNGVLADDVLVNSDLMILVFP